MQSFRAKRTKIAIFREQKLLPMKMFNQFHSKCDLNHDSSRKTTKHFELKENWSFYKIAIRKTIPTPKTEVGKNKLTIMYLYHENIP